MSVMVTGGTGFVGLNLVEALLARGEAVVVVALDDVPAPALRGFAGLPGRLAVERMDVRDQAGLVGLMRRHGVDRLFPFAAITSGPEREAEAPELVIEVNLLGFVAQLRAAREAGVRRVIAPSSAAVYGESFYAHARLDEARTPAVPVGVYGVTKYAVERTALRLGALWGVEVIAARIGSVFGPWERDTGLRDMIGPHWHLARMAQEGREAVLPAVIPAYTWVYSRDVAAGLLHLLDMAAPSGVQCVFGDGVGGGDRRLGGAVAGGVSRVSLAAVGGGRRGQCAVYRDAAARGDGCVAGGADGVAAALRAGGGLCRLCRVAAGDGRRGLRSPALPVRRGGGGDLSCLVYSLTAPVRLET